MEHALPPENGDFLVELELLFILFCFGPLRSKETTFHSETSLEVWSEKRQLYWQAIVERVSFTFQTRSLQLFISLPCLRQDWPYFMILIRFVLHCRQKGSQI